MKIYKGRSSSIKPLFAPIASIYVETDTGKAFINTDYKNADNGWILIAGSSLNKGAFTGEFDVDNFYGTIYDDYTSGDVVNLSLSSNPIPGTASTVRIQGDLTGTIPAEWNFRGDDISTLDTELNELTLLYISPTDIRLSNVVITI